MAEGDAVKIDSDTFHDRLSSFLAAWKADKRSGDNVFGGASSLVLLMGKSEEASGFFKNGAFQVKPLKLSDGLLQKLTLRVAAVAARL